MEARAYIISYPYKSGGFMRITDRAVEEIRPYEKNAKKHPDEQIERIANSIREFGWQQPLVVDKNDVLVIGHGRLLAAKKLGLKTVPVRKAEDLTDEQIRALRLADNKTNESGWDFGILDEELDSIIDFDMTQFGFSASVDFEDIDGLFTDAPEKEKEPKRIQCPHCGEWIEL